MRHVIQRHSARVLATDATYAPVVLGQARPDGTWEGSIEFRAVGNDASRPILATGRETTQPNREALEYWASGLEPLYFEGAFARALPPRLSRSRT
jgi:hypothetical protein